MCTRHSHTLVRSNGASAYDLVSKMPSKSSQDAAGRGGVPCAMHHDHVGGHHGDANQACLHPEGIALQRRVCQLHQQHECCEHCAQNVALHTSNQSFMCCNALHGAYRPLLALCGCARRPNSSCCLAGHSAVLRLIFCAERCSMQGLGHGAH